MNLTISFIHHTITIIKELFDKKIIQALIKIMKTHYLKKKLKKKWTFPFQIKNLSSNLNQSTYIIQSNQNTQVVFNLFLFVVFKRLKYIILL